MNFCPIKNSVSCQNYCYFFHHILDFIDFVRYKRGIKEKKVVKLEGVLKGHDIDLSDLKAFRKETWRHVDSESDNE